MGVNLLADQSIDVLAAPAAGGGASMIPLLVIAGAFLLFMMWSNRSRQKRAAQFRASLRPGQKVQLAGGLIGDLVTIGEREAFVELAPGVVVTVVPQAVQGVISDPAADLDEADEPHLELPEENPEIDTDSAEGDNTDR